MGPFLYCSLCLEEDSFSLGICLKKSKFSDILGKSKKETSIFNRWKNPEEETPGWRDQ